MNYYKSLDGVVCASSISCNGQLKPYTKDISLQSSLAIMDLTTIQLRFSDIQVEQVSLPNLPYFPN